MRWCVAFSGKVLENPPLQIHKICYIYFSLKNMIQAQCHKYNIGRDKSFYVSKHELRFPNNSHRVPFLWRLYVRVSCEALGPRQIVNDRRHALIDCLFTIMQIHSRLFNNPTTLLGRYCHRIVSYPLRILLTDLHFSQAKWFSKWTRFHFFSREK